MKEQFDLHDIVAIIKQRIGLIISCSLAAVLIAAFLSYFMVNPVYETSAQILVNQEQQGTGQLSGEQVQANLQLITTYSEIIESPAILNRIVEELNLNSSAETLMDKITVESSPDSQVITIFVRDGEPKAAVEIANGTAAVFQEEIKKLMSIENVTILSAAEKAASVGLSPELNMSVASVVGLLFGMGVAFLLAYMDKTVESEQDIERLLGIPVIGIIPQIASGKQDKEVPAIALSEKEV